MAAIICGSMWIFAAAGQIHTDTQLIPSENSSRNFGGRDLKRTVNSYFLNLPIDARFGYEILLCFRYVPHDDEVHKGQGRRRRACQWAFAFRLSVR